MLTPMRLKKLLRKLLKHNPCTKLRRTSNLFPAPQNFNIYISRIAFSSALITPSTKYF